MNIHFELKLSHRLIVMFSSPEVISFTKFNTSFMPAFQTIIFIFHEARRFSVRTRDPLTGPKGVRAPGSRTL